MTREMTVPRKQRLGPLVAAAAVLALTGGATALLARLDRTRAAERAAEEAQAAALRAADGVHGVIGALEVQAQNATTNPRLVAALDANVDQETLRDLLLTEPWWEPFRRAVDGYGLYSDESTGVVTSHLPPGFDGRTDWPVLVATRMLDAGLLSGIADRAGAALAVSDGRRVLIGAPGNGAGAGENLAALKQEPELAAPGLQSLGPRTMATLPLSGKLRVLVGVSAPPSAPSGLPLPWSELAILSIGVAFAFGVFFLLRRQLPAHLAAEQAGAQPAGDPIASVGRYALVEQLGQGGMAEIYAAVTTGEGSFRRPVVIKRLRPELIADPAAVSQFCDEANLLAALHHPNIVAVHDFGRSQNQYFLAEEYVAGRNLGRIIERRLSSTRRPLPVEIIAHVGCEILKGLEYAHSLRDGDGRPLAIVHRDVSPENVMISALGEVKLLDFGVVKAEGRLTKTETGVVKGNVTYMAPEQARGLEVDARADLYSLALVLYFCCAGRPLYAADTTYGLLMKAGAGPGIEERASIRQLPRPFAAVVERATAQRIEERYGSAREMALDLEAWARAGVTLTGALVTELFGDELKDEAHRLAAFAPETAFHPIADASGS